MKKLDKEILDLKFTYHDFGRELTVRGFLKELLTTLFDQMEGFSGKRPFGNSGWEGDLEAAFIKAGYVTGELDEDGYISNSNGDEFKLAINYAIDSL